MKIASISIADYCEATEGMPHDAERLYWRILLKIHSREAALPDDDAQNARMFGYDDVRTYKAVKRKLLAWPNAISIEDGLIRNERALKEVAAFKKFKSQSVENGRKGGRPKARSAGDQPEIRVRSPVEVETIPHTTVINFNEFAKPSPTPSPSPRSEESKEEQAAPPEQEPARTPPSPAALPGSLDDLHSRLVDACNGSLDNPVNCLGLLSMATPQMWLERGADLERDVIPTLQAAGKKYHGKRIRDWSYFTGMVADAVEKRRAPMKPGKAAPPRETDRERRARIFEKLEREGRI